MGITEKEDILFNKWMKKEGRKPFVMDGSPSPREYCKAKLKVLFILKDANFGISGEDQKSGNYGGSPHYDLRKELESDPNVWWSKVRDWCAPLLHDGLAWHELKNKDIAESLSPFVFMQLKKNAGAGSVTSGVLRKIAREDSLEIKEQISIYRPDIIVCCGVGEIVYKVVFSGNSNLRFTPMGVGYWDVENDNSEKKTYIIDYCHPSARFGTKLEGVVSLGLVETINYLRTTQDQAI